MATASPTSKLPRVIQFTPEPHAKRRTLRLGRVDLATKQTIQSHLHELLNHRNLRQPLARATAAWLKDLIEHRSPLYARLVKLELVEEERRSEEPMSPPSVPLGAFLDSYIKGRTDLKPWSKRGLVHCRNSLVKFFGEAAALRDIDKGLAGDWQRAVKLTHSAATVAGFVKKARRMFRDALDRGLIASNPFVGIKAGKMSNPARQRYIPGDVVMQAIAKCPDAELKLIFAMARWGGLRIPSESDALRWADVQWDAGRIVVRSPKTAHHPGRDKRVIPLFPELVPCLNDVRAMAAGAADHVVAWVRSGAYLHKLAVAAVKAAGLSVWPRIFQNLRSSFETDLTARFPLHVACAWAGNTEAVALEHYLSLPDAYYDIANGRRAAICGAAQDQNNWGRIGVPLNLHEKLRYVRVKMPPVGSQPERYYAEFSRLLHRAGSKALRSLVAAGPELRRADIAMLSRRVRQARHRRAGRERG